MHEKSPGALRNRRRVAVPIVCSFLVFFVGGPSARAQRANFTAEKTEPTISLHELSIPARARKDCERGIERLSRQDPGGSLRYFARAIEAAPWFYEAYYHQGVAEQQLNRDRDAARSFQQAIDLSHGHFPRAEFGYALSLTRLGDAAEAERVVRHGLETNANIPDGHVVLGLVLLELNRVDEAEKSAQEALCFNDPTAIKARLVLADIHGSRGDFAAQAQDLDAYLKSSPNDRNKTVLGAARDIARRMAERVRAGHLAEHPAEQMGSAK
jgi:tetratricopeptide (TPR) repeat protein